MGNLNVNCRVYFKHIIVITIQLKICVHHFAVKKCTIGKVNLLSSNSISSRILDHLTKHKKIGKDFL